MKILFIQPTNAIGGAEYSLLSLIKYLHKNKHNIFISIPYSNDKEYTKLLEPYVDGFVFVKPMPWHIENNFKFGFKRFINFLYRSYRSQGWHFAPVIKIYRFIKKNKIDLVHTNTMLAIDGAIAAKFSGVTHIQHVREAIGLTKDSLFRFPLQGRSVIFKKIMSFLHQGVIANSNYTLNLSKPYFSTQKLTCIHNPISNIFFENQIIRKSSEKKIIGMIGNVTSKVKNHQLLIEIANLYKKSNSNLDIQFNIYGKLPNKNDPYFLELEKLITIYKLKNIVKFKGYCDSVTIYREIDLLIHTCPNEAFGRIYIEAMAMRVPVITVKGGGALELIEDDVNGFLIDMDNPGAFVKKVENLISDKNLYRNIAENGFIFSNKFRSDLISSKVEDYYNIIIYGKKKEK
jgi:glycosyltransferase involved in cell wall biosynthesis